MEQQKLIRNWEYMIYCIFCVLTLGLLAVFRVMISQAIYKASQYK